MKSDDGHDQEPEGAMPSFGNIFDGMQGILSGLQVVPDKAGAKPEKPKKGTGPKRPLSAKLAKAQAEIAARPDNAETAYLARQIVQCSLPRIDPGEKSVFVRRDGNCALVMEARTDPDTMKKRGLPSGAIAKVIWLWINTEAVYNKNSPDVENKYRLVCGKTFNDYLLKLGLDPNTGGGKFSHGKTVKDELMKLLLCLFSFHYSEGDSKKGRKSFVDLRIASAVHLWWDEKNSGQGAFFESEIILDKDFFEAVTLAPVPVDMRVVVALIRSPLAIDLYTWITYRSHTAKKAGKKEIKISIAALKEQFGTEYNRADNFKAAVSKALTKIETVCPSLDYTLDSKALVLRIAKAKPALAERSEKHPALEFPNQISPKMRERFQKKYPLHKVDDAFAEFDDWRSGKGIVSQDTDGHFWDFVTNHYFKK